MGYVLAVDLGTTITAVAVADQRQVAMVSLGHAAITEPSLVYLTDEGSFLAGTVAAQQARHDPVRSAREFKRRFGDTTPLFLGGTPISADQLTRILFEHAVSTAVKQIGTEPSNVVVTHPANWGEYKRALLHDTLLPSSPGTLSLITEPTAAAINYAQQERIGDGSTLAVYDLGGGTFDVAVLRKVGEGWKLLGRSGGIERLGGIDFDETVFRMLLGRLGIDPETSEDLDEDDPVVRSAFADLRAESVSVKEQLSSATSAIATSVIPGHAQELRVTRAEFEKLIKPSLVQTLDVLDRTIAGAGAVSVERVLLVGGSSRIPMIGELISGQLGLGVSVDSHPKHATALGAAVSRSPTSVESARSAASPRDAMVVPEPAPVAGRLADGADDDPTLPAPEDLSESRDELLRPSFDPPLHLSSPSPLGESDGSSAPWRSRRLLGSIAVLVLLVAAGLGVRALVDDGVSDVERGEGLVEESAGLVEEPEGATTSTTARAADGSEPSPVVTPGASGRLAAVQAAGTLRCGVNDSLPGFGMSTGANSYAGFDIDFCRVVAAAIIGSAEAVDYVPLTASERFSALDSGAVDILFRNTSWTASRDGVAGGNFVFPTFYDGQSFMVATSSGPADLDGLAGEDVCVLGGTGAERTLRSVSDARDLALVPIVFTSMDELRAAYVDNACTAWTSFASELAAWKEVIEAETGQAQLILSQAISLEPLGPVVADTDPEFAQAVRWALFATVQAWEFGLDSGSIASYSGDDPDILRFLGREAGFDAGVGLPDGFAVRVIADVGNYEEIYRRNLAPIGLELTGSPNDLWSSGGLMFAPAYR